VSLGWAARIGCGLVVLPAPAPPIGFGAADGGVVDGDLGVIALVCGSVAGHVAIGDYQLRAANPEGLRRQELRLSDALTLSVFLAV